MQAESGNTHRSVETLAVTLAQIRARSKLTQAQVAARMDTTQTAIARLESGRQVPSVQTLQNYARANGFCLEIGFIRSATATAKTGCILVIEDMLPDIDQTATRDHDL